MDDHRLANGASLQMEPDSAFPAWLDAIPLALVLVDADLLISGGNTIAKELLSLTGTPTSLLGFLVSRQEVQCLQDAFTLAMRGASARSECRLRTANGVLISGRLTFRRLEPFSSQCMVLVEDVSPSLQATKEAMRLQQLGVLGKIACGIGHDLANLTMMLGFRLAKIESELSGHEGVQKMLKETVKTTETIQELSRRLVYLGREHRFQARPVDANKAVRDAMALLIGTLGKGIKTMISCPAMPAMVWCDPVQLEQALLNLVLNAREAIPDSGHISAKVSFCEVTAKDGSATPSEYVSLSIKDDGCGIALDVQAHIFDPFFTTKESGTGMGLAVVKSAIEKTGGIVRMESQLGHGTTLEILLPRWVEP